MLQQSASENGLISGGALHSLCEAAIENRVGDQRKKKEKKYNRVSGLSARYAFATRIKRVRVYDRIPSNSNIDVGDFSGESWSESCPSRDVKVHEIDRPLRWKDNI